MIFETVPVAAAEGAILVHSARADDRVLKKGRVLTADDLRRLAAAGTAEVTIVRLEPTDVGEDEAARTIAEGFAGAHVRIGAPFTGRANLYARTNGLLMLNADAINAANRVHEAVTIATLPEFARVSEGDMIATVKIIPYAAPKSAVTTATNLGAAAQISVAPFRELSVAIVSTRLPSSKASVTEKTRASLEARITPLGGRLFHDSVVAHDSISVAAALSAARKTNADLYLVMGASAISDRRDVIPAGIEEAGGNVLHFGMPVDPGNLLLYAEMDNKPVIGLPGCARSPKLNGFDFVLQRLFAGLAIKNSDITGMGVGGLLAEISSRPQPREKEDIARPRAPRIAALVLAAGLSSRMGSNKLLARIGDSTLIRRTVEATLAAHARPVIVVTGNEAAGIQSALSGLDLQFAHNPHFADGLSASLRAGLKAVPDDCDGVLVLLGDMPEISAKLLDRMLAAFSPADGRAICVASFAGKRGNPVLWARRFFAEMESVSGDTGAKHLIGTYEDLVCEIEADESVLNDIDTQDALAALRTRMSAQVHQ